MPRVAEVKASLDDLNKSLRAITGIKAIKIFGSLAEHINNPAYRIKDIDIIAVTPYTSEDLLAINSEAFSIRPEYLEEEGFDPKAVKFSRDFTRLVFADLPIDCWCLSADKKLLHWGPIFTAKDESDEMRVEAEKFASKETGFNLKRLAKASEESRSNWYSSYRSYLQKHFEEMPVGWYCSEVDNIKEILAQSFELAK